MIHDKRLCPLVLAIIFLLCGCAVGPDFTRPPVKVAGTWLDANDQRVKTESAEYRNWWRAFNDPVLAGLIDQAYRENLPLRIAGLRVLEARAQLGIAIGGLFPQTQQAFGFYQYNLTSEHAPNFVSPLLHYQQAEIGVMASWELDFWGKFRRAVESADTNLLATLADTTVPWSVLRPMWRFPTSR